MCVNELLHWPFDNYGVWWCLLIIRNVIDEERASLELAGFFKSGFFYLSSISFNFFITVSICSSINID